MELVEITTTELHEPQLTERFNYFDSVAFIPIPVLKTYIECPKEFRVKQLYMILLAVRGMDRPCKERIYNKLNISRTSGMYRIDYLCNAGYIDKVKRARLIIPFQKYKQDTGYKLSVKGKAAIYAIIKASLPS